MSQIVYCTCPLQPDNSSSDRSLVGFGLSATQLTLNSLFFSRPDHTIPPMFSTSLPRPTPIAPEVNSTPEGLQATSIASPPRDRLQHPAAGNSPRSTTMTSFANVSSPSAELYCCFKLCLRGTELYVTQGNTGWGVQF